MYGYFNYFYDFITRLFTSIGVFFRDLFVNFGEIFNVADYSAILKAYSSTFRWYEWVLTVVSIILILCIIGMFISWVVLKIIDNVRLGRLKRDKSALLGQVESLNRKVMRLMSENDRIMAMQVARSGLVAPTGISEDQAPDVQKAAVSRFVKLNEVDAKYNNVIKPFGEKETYDLHELVVSFRAFANNTLKLFYDEETIRVFVSGMACSRMLILEGISGTGKTSLPYAWGKFVQNATTLVPVQPSWRDKTELIGYFNEFTKRFNETDFLRAVYEATYREDISFVVLDEMNLARVEYYFASVLSILEMPNREEWRMEIVPDTWETDPKHLIDGNILFPPNVWFVGTANQDDSTFTITDKVYDRAMTIELNSKGKPFDIPPSPAQRVSLKHLEGLFNAAKNAYPLSDATRDKFDKLDDFVISHFRLAFGNRILKQLYDFVPVYVACGGTELDAVDYILTVKILRKLQNLNLSFVQDSLKDLKAELDTLFGKKAMPRAKEYIDGLLKLA